MSAVNQATVRTNSEWFADNDRYMAGQSKLECYRHIRKMVERELKGVKDLLDVGNGGFFNYDTGLVGHATAVDLFLKDGPGPEPNSTFKQGSFLDLPFAASSYDCVLEENVFHHVTGRNVHQNFANLDRCMSEMFRVLRKGGKAVIIESTVGRLFNMVENLLYKPALLVKRRGHPVTYQFTPRQLMRSAEQAGFQVEEFAYIPRGWFLLQMGYRWPSCLTPAKPIKLILRK
jgi:SAM-dependent methyltransferase